MGKINKDVDLKDEIQLTLRECEIKDIDQLEGLLETIGKETNFTLQRPGIKLNKELAQKAWERSLNSKDEIYLGAFVKDKLIGQIHMRVLEPVHPWISHVARFGMFIIKDYWGKGIGKNLVLEMIEFAKSIGVKRIEATVRSKNKRAIELYERLGFEVEGVRNKAAYIDGEFQDEYYIAYLID